MYKGAGGVKGPPMNTCPVVQSRTWTNPNPLLPAALWSTFGRSPIIASLAASSSWAPPMSSTPSRTSFARTCRMYPSAVRGCPAPQIWWHTMGKWWYTSQNRPSGSLRGIEELLGAPCSVSLFFWFFAVQAPQHFNKHSLSPLQPRKSECWPVLWSQRCHNHK